MRNERRNGTAFTAEDAEDAEKGENGGKTTANGKRIRGEIPFDLAQGKPSSLHSSG